MKQSILIVDDTIENIDVLEAMLSEDYKIKAAINGKVALKIAERNLPDLILLDIMMPGMDGYEVCEKLKDNPKTAHIPVIFVTAMAEEEDEERGFNLGAVDYIIKPFRKMIVKARIVTHLALSNQQRELDIQVKEKTIELEQSKVDLVKTLGRASEYKDNETGLHVLRMSKYCGLIAHEYGLSDKDSLLLEIAAPMHDIGKIGIEDSVIGKPGKLNAAEWEHMKEHCAIGVEILGKHDDELLNTAAIIAGEHHERWNGLGYPNGISGDDIHIFSRICAVADVFDALTSKRPYKEAWTVEDALTEIQNNRGTQFDPLVVDAFMRIIEEVKKVSIALKE